MTRSHTLIRTLATTLAISALAAPAAGARPVDVHAIPAVSPVTAHGTDLRAPDQQVPARPSQDLRSPDARDAGLRPLGPGPVSSVPVQADDPDGTPWLTIGLALLGCLALAGTAAAAGRIHRTRRAGVAA